MRATGSFTILTQGVATVTRHTITMHILECTLLILLALFLFDLVPPRAFSNEAPQVHDKHSVEDEKHKAQTSGHGHHHGHHHGPEGCKLHTAVPENSPSPEQLARQAELRREALAKAREIFRGMEVDSAMTALGLGFDHEGRYFDMGMTLEQALIRVLAGGNRCRFKHAPKTKSSCQLDIISKGKSVISLLMQPSGDKLLIQSMTLSRLNGDGGIKETGARAAFYLMTFMRAR